MTDLIIPDMTDENTDGSDDSIEVQTDAKLIGIASWMDGGGTLTFGDMCDIPQRCDIEADENRYAAFKTDVGMLVVPESKVGVIRE